MVSLSVLCLGLPPSSKAAVNVLFCCRIAGAIQGSILDPILFLIFIMDIKEVIPPAAIIQKYTDDILTYILNSTEAPSNLSQEIINAIDK